MDYAIPASKIASLSSGEFVGFVADNPEQKIVLKMFHSEIQNDHAAIAREEKGYVDIPVVQKVSREEIAENYDEIKRQIAKLVVSELKRISAGKAAAANNNSGSVQQSESKTVKAKTNKVAKAKGKIIGGPPVSY